MQLYPTSLTFIYFYHYQSPATPFADTFIHSLNMVTPLALKFIDSSYKITPIV